MLSNQVTFQLKLQYINCQTGLVSSNYHISYERWTDRIGAKLSLAFENTCLESLGFTQPYNLDILHYQLAAKIDFFTTLIEDLIIGLQIGPLSSEFICLVSFLYIEFR